MQYVVLTSISMLINLKRYSILVGVLYCGCTLAMGVNIARAMPATISVIMATGITVSAISRSICGICLANDKT